MGLNSYIMRIVRAYLRIVHDADTIQQRFPDYHLADKFSGSYQGVIIALLRRTESFSDIDQTRNAE